VPLVSRPESIRLGKPSLLAVFETIAATAGSIWLAWKYNSLAHLVIAGALTPFLVLRTRLSTWYTIRVYHIVRQKLGSETLGNLGLFLPIYLLPILKVFCLWRVFWRRPLKTFSNIPFNFYRNIFVIDFFTSPQVISGLDEIRTSSGWIRELNVYTLSHDPFGELYAQVKYLGIRSVHIVSWLRTYLFGYLPFILFAFSFRFAIKSAAIIWLPLLWIMHQSNPGMDIVDRIDRQVYAPWTAITLIYSIGVVLASMFKVAVHMGKWKIENLDSHSLLSTFAIGLIAPNEIPGWQIAGFVNALLAWGFFCWAVPEIRAYRRASTEIRSNLAR
jgi:hypothetical protein